MSSGDDLRQRQVFTAKYYRDTPTDRARFVFVGYLRPRNSIHPPPPLHTMPWQYISQRTNFATEGARQKPCNVRLLDFCSFSLFFLRANVSRDAAIIRRPLSSWPVYKAKRKISIQIDRKTTTEFEKEKKNQIREITKPSLTCRPAVLPENVFSVLCCIIYARNDCKRHCNNIIRSDVFLDFNHDSRVR